MSYKWYVACAVALGLLTTAPAHGAGWDWENLQNAAAAVGRFGDKVANATRDGIDAYQKRSAENHQARMDDLYNKINDESIPPSLRKAYEQELLNETQSHQRSQKAWEEMPQQLMKNGIQLGTQLAEGAIQEGLAQFAHERDLQKAAVDAKFRGKAIVESTKETIKALLDPNNLGKLVLTSGGVFGLYFTLKYGIPLIADQYRKPALADPEKTSLKFGPVNFIKSLISGTEKVEASLSDVILKPELAERINVTVQSLKNTVANGGYLKNIMLWGQPGTGKTMLAMRMARSCGLEYIYFTASNLEPFSTEEASSQLIQLFRYAQSSPKKLMIIIDEAEALLGSRGNANVTDKKRTLLNLILGYTGTETRDYMVTILTNRPEDIDEAFLSRCDDRIQIGAPAPTERRAILQLYVDKLLKNGENLKPHRGSMLSTKYWFGKEVKVNPPAIADGALSEAALDRLSDKLKGFVGRDISKLVIEIQSSALATEENKITTALINRVVDFKLTEREEAKKGFIRDGFTRGAPKS